MQLVLDKLKLANIETEAESLDEFYAGVVRQAMAANTPLAGNRPVKYLLLSSLAGLAYDRIVRTEVYTPCARRSVPQQRCFRWWSNICKAARAHRPVVRSTGCLRVNWTTGDASIVRSRRVKRFWRLVRPLHVSAR